MEWNGTGKQQWMIKVVTMRMMRWANTCEMGGKRRRMICMRLAKWIKKVTPQRRDRVMHIRMSDGDVQRSWLITEPGRQQRTDKLLPG